jgi:3'-phosphoadenosine 5'-phosphosulfate sulfotransferase (PAPS reductase)/FAD synthetase
VSAFANLPAYRDLPEQLVLTFSGGRSSAYQLAHIIEANGGLPKGSFVTFQNTGFELPETLAFVHRFGEHFGIEIVWLEHDPHAETKVKVVSHNSAARNGEPMIAMFSTPLIRKDKTLGLRPLPNPVQRTCSAEMKTKTSHRYVRRHLGWPNRYWSAIGYRADEPGRVERRRKQEERYVNSCPEGGWGVFPMYAAGVTAEDVLAFWEKMPFDLGIESWEGNCDFCFMKSEWKIKAMMQARPDRLQPWLDLEAAARDRSDRFRKDRKDLATLWREVQANDLTAAPQDPSIECSSCTGDVVTPEESDEGPGNVFD